MNMQRLQAVLSGVSALVFVGIAGVQLYQTIDSGRWVPWWNRVEVGEPCSKPAQCWSDHCIGDTSGVSPLPPIFGQSVSGGFCSMECTSDADCTNSMVCHDVVGACVPGPLRENGEPCEHGWQCEEGACGVNPGTLFEPSTSTDPECLDDETVSRIKSMALQRQLGL